jgi:hypothetical protein
VCRISFSSEFTREVAELSPRVLFSAVLLLLLPVLVHAQRFEFSLDDLPDYSTETVWDTLGPGDITRLQLGPWHKVPNFLESDFSRDRVIEEFHEDGRIRITFRLPPIYPFDFEEERQGVFYVFRPRDLGIPGLDIKIDFLDDIVAEIEKDSRDETWRSNVRSSLMRMKREVAARKGLIHVDIPIPLPKTVERIIGKGEASNIDISGRENITFSGESRRISPFIGVEGQQKQPLFPSLDMKQELDVRLQGTIGEKINVQVDHTSNAVSDKQNRIRLNYKGFEDDVVKLIEMGNTNLSLPGSQLVSFSTNSQGLFGIKALAQVGPVDVTMIASKQEGQVSRTSFTPRGAAFTQTETKTIRDIDYVKNKYFFLDLPASNVFFTPKEGEIEVFESVYSWERTVNPDLVTFYGRAWVDRFGDGSDIKNAVSLLKQGQTPPPFQEADFKLLQLGDDYRFVLNSEDESVLGIELVQAIEDNKILAVRYVNDRGDTIGNYNDFTDTLALEIIKPRDPLPTDDFGYTWHFMMRHIYNLGLSNIDGGTLELEIEDTSNRLETSTPEGSTVPYLRIFGLDRTDESGVGPPDNRIDLTTGLIDLQQGILTFPTLRPFDPPPDLVAEWTDSSFSFTGDYADLPIPELYDDFLSVPADYHRFNIVVKASSMTKTFFLNAFNIIEGSEVVTLDGRRLQRNRDYTIDYDTGEVELQGDILNELTPASRINIDYEFKPFAGGASSSLVGFNSLVHLSKNSRVGTTWLYESKTSGAGKPRLGEESSRSVVGDIDSYLQFHPSFLTSLVNKLPLVDTDAKSMVTISGEMAMSIPDPNTRGEAYVDDMEGVEDSDVIPMTRRSWVEASPPLDPSQGQVAGALPASLREKFFWYNIEPELGVHRLDWNPQLDERENTLIPSIDIEMDTMTVDSTRWAGIMTGFPGGGLDLSRSQFIEIWVNDFKPDTSSRDGVIYIEMGNIDEDFFEPDKDEYNTEDKNRDGFNALTEDTGLDGEYDDQGDVDVAGDDYDPARIDGRFIKINGTERNGYLDDEDLDGSGQMEKDNYYFRFAVRLADSAIIDVRRDFPGQVSDSYDSWRMYRIDLSQAEIVSQTGTPPRMERIRHLRVWFDHINKVINPATKRLQIAGFKVVGNRWEEDGVRDSTETLLTRAEAGGTEFKLGVISTKTDPIKYSPPFTPGERDQIVEKEQSLFVKFDDLGPKTSFRIRKRFPGNGLDFTTYRDLNFWMHTDVRSDSLEYFFRVAFDSLNFYEITIPMTDQYLKASGWILASVKLTDLSALKFLPRDSLVSDYVNDIVVPSRSYKVNMIGRPNLFNVKFFYAGLRNKSTQRVYSGEIWIDDIYLGGVKRDVDFAQRFSTSIALANVMNLNLGWRRTGPDYHGLRQKTGSGTETSSLNMNGKTRLEYFIPLFGFNIPISGNYSRNRSLPKFKPNSDTEISDKVLQDSLRTESVIKGFSATLSKRKSKNPLLKYTFDRIRANFSMSKSQRVSPSSADTTTSMTGTFDYQMNWSRKRKVRIFKGYKLRYWLNSLTFRVQASKRKGKRYRFTSAGLVADPPIYSAGLQASGSATYVPFPSLTTSFKMNMKRDVALPHKLFGIDVGKEINRSQTLQTSYKPPPVWFIKAFSPDFNYTATYSENSSPNIRKAGDPKGVRNVTSSQTGSVKMRFDLGRVFRKIFKAIHLEEKREEEKAPGKPAAPSRRRGSNPRDRNEKPAEAKPDTTKASKKPDATIAFRRLGGILSRIRKINASLQRRTSSSYSRIGDRPTLAYQLGFTKDSGVWTKGVRNKEPERFTETLSLTMDSGTQLTRNIDIAGRYSASFNNATFRENESKSKTVTWPDLNLSWKSLEKLGVFRGLFVSSSANLGFKKTIRESGRGSTTDNTNSTIQISPSLVAKWKNGMNTTLTVARNKKVNESHGSKTELTSFSTSMELKYSFTGGQGFRLPLPFLSKKFKFKSTLDTTLSISYSRTGGQRKNALLSIPEPIPGTNSLKVSPRLTYNFSRTLNGSFFVDYTRTYSEASNQTTTLVRVGINAIFTF